MLPRIAFRYGMGWFAHACLSLWSGIWLVAVVMSIRAGSVNYGDGDFSETFTRVDRPVAFWTVIGVMSGLVLLGLVLTFELDFSQREDSSDEEPAKKRPANKRRANKKKS